MNKEELIKNIESVNEKINKDYETISISEIIGMLQEPFDGEAVAQKTHDKHFNNPESQYYQMSVEQILEAWSAKGAESTHYGKLLDDFIGFNLEKDDNARELWELDNNYGYDERLTGLCESFTNMYNHLMENGELEFVTREQTLYYEVPEMQVYIKGRFDALFYNKVLNKYLIVDWKSSKTVDKKKTPWTKQLFGPMAKYPDLNWYTYTLQTHFYKKALIKNYLPEGTKESDVYVLIIQLPGNILPTTNTNYEIHQEAFTYDSELLDKLFVYAKRKKDLLKKQANQ